MADSHALCLLGRSRHHLQVDWTLPLLHGARCGTYTSLRSCLLSRLMFLVSDLTGPLSTADLLAIRARQLQKCPADLATIHDRIFASRHASVHQFEKQYANTIHDFNFTLGTLVLVHNTSLTMDKMKPRYLRPMIVLRRTCNGTYRLGELDGSISRLTWEGQILKHVLGVLCTMSHKFLNCMIFVCLNCMVLCA